MRTHTWLRAALYCLSLHCLSLPSALGQTAPPDALGFTLGAGLSFEDAGGVSVWLDGDQLNFEFSTNENWTLASAKLALASSLTAIPQSLVGTPAPAYFPYGGTPSGSDTVIVQVPLASTGLVSGETAFMAAHAIVQPVANGAAATAWALGSPFPWDPSSQYASFTVPSQLELSAASGSKSIQLEVGSVQNVATVISLQVSGASLETVVKTTTITPRGGLGLTEDYPFAGYQSFGSTSFVLNQSFTGLAVGSYVVENTFDSAGVMVTETIIIEVVPVGGEPVLLPLGSYPDAIPVGRPSEVLFTAAVSQTTVPPAHLDLFRTDGTNKILVGVLLDDGLEGDLQAGDGVYSGRAVVSRRDAGAVGFLARGLFRSSGSLLETSIHEVIVTALPTTVAPFDPAKVILEPVTGGELVCDEILVAFDRQPDDADVLAFAASFNATLVGAIHGLGIYQLQIQNPDCTPDALLAALAQIQADPSVALASPNFIAETQDIVPNDSIYGFQYAPQKVRAEEAWVIARGGPVIAVIDTGVDYNHPDLAGKVILGPDFYDGDSDPMDDNGHGTHCAGIAAANGNNGVGMAGIAWSSKVLAIRSLGGPKGSGSISNLVAGIKAAADQGCKVLSCSFGAEPGILSSFASWLFGLESAVNYAAGKGALVVVAAGNENNTAVNLPGAYPTSFCVGATDASDGRWVSTPSSGSCFGPEVDIAAPGSEVWSCLNGGGYGPKWGTSMATPCIAGAAALVWARYPNWSAAQVRKRIQTTAVDLSGLGLGAGRLDLFEAVFNGSFEDGTEGWTSSGTSGAVPALGPIQPEDRERMGFISSGPDASQVQSSLEQAFTVMPGVSSFDITFNYNFVTEEYPEFVGTQFNDNMRIELVSPGGGATQLAYEDVNSSSFSSIGGIDFPGGDNTVGQTGWKTVSMSIPVTQGPGVYRVVVRDEGDGIYDSNVMLDAISFK